jgi:2-polyprenyl-3-methyl-5-hydroxy-6-metoxy-1,4-benzoquinol methylase
MDKKKAALYQEAYMADYGFEGVMVHYRRKLLLERLNKFHPAVVVEIGCGSELLYEKWHRLGKKVECWIIVEPAEYFADIARASDLPNLYVVNEFFENAAGLVQSRLPRQPEMVICSSLLHEVPSASELLAAIRLIMGEASLLHLNVPNSESFHRYLARSIGIIANTKVISDRNTKLLQHRIYDIQSLKVELISAGFNVSEEGGYFVKPFTHEQMEKIVSVIGDHILDGLYLLGRELPELASEIFVEARTVKQ